jgi:hypothetical protein
MNLGQTVFSQVVDHLPRYEFLKCVSRYRGDYQQKSFSCWDQFLAMAFAQLTYRESLRDIEACLRSMSGKLYHMGFRSRVARSTLAEANESRDWRIYADFAQVLIGIARPLYARDPIGVDLDQSLYALDSTTIDLCLSLFPWVRFRKHKGAVKMHTLLDLHGNIPTFISVTDGKVHDVNILDEILPEAGAFYVMDRGYVDFERLFVFTLCSAFEEAIQVSHQQLHASGTYYRPNLQVPLAGGIVLQVDQAAPADQGLLRHQRKCGEDPDLDCGLGLRAGGHCSQAPGAGGKPLPNSTDFERDAFRKNARFTGTSSVGLRGQLRRVRQPVDSIRLLAGH